MSIIIMNAWWAALLLICTGFRVRKAKDQKPISIEGVDVKSYPKNNKDWIILFDEDKGMTTDLLENFCKGRCQLMGHPSSAGFAFAKIQAKASEVQDLLLAQDAAIRVTIKALMPDVRDFVIPEKKAKRTEPTSWGLERVGVPDRFGTGKGTHIYVQDTGIRASHKDFGGRVVPTLDLTSGSVVECKGKVGCAHDGHSHGSHCAGTAGGTLYGVASDAELHAVKTLDNEGGGDRSWQYAALDWMAGNAIKPAVISMSLGGYGQDPGYDRALAAVTSAGIVAVVAGGNSNSDTCDFSPAFSSYAITVGSTDSNNAKSYFSNWGPCNNILAPGSDITSVNGMTDDEYTVKSGTSMACPHVSGAVALILAKAPTLTYRQILQVMKEEGRKDFISGSFPGDPNEFLWVGRNPAPTSAPTPAPPPAIVCPDFAAWPYPDSDGDCACSGNQRCTTDGKSANCPSSGGLGGWGGSYFSPDCDECYCMGGL